MTGELNFSNPGVTGLRFYNPKETGVMRLVLRGVSNGIEICNRIESRYCHISSKFSQSLYYNSLPNQHVMLAISIAF